MPFSCAASRPSTTCFDELERERQHAVRFLEPVDGRDAGMIQRREHLGLAAEPGDAVGILRERRGQYLDRSVAVELRIAGTIDLPHPARADGADDLVWANPRPGAQRHRLAPGRAHHPRAGRLLSLCPLPGPSAPIGVMISQGPRRVTVGRFIGEGLAPSVP